MSIIAIAGVAYLVLVVLFIGWCAVNLAGNRAVVVWDDEANASKSGRPIKVRPTWVRRLSAPRRPLRR